MTQERRSKKPIGEWLVAEELISQGELLEALAWGSGSVVPMWTEQDGTLVVLTADPTDIVAMDDVRLSAGARRLRPIVTSPDRLSDALKRVYLSDGSQTGALLDQISTDSESVDDADDIVDSVEERAPVIRLAEQIIHDALHGNASDIHVEPGKTSSRVRYRIDGVLQEVMQIPKNVHGPLISRLKLIASLDIAERRRPQDGRSTYRSKDSEVDLRVSTLPLLYGEKMVMRLLRKGAEQLQLDEVGLSAEQHANVLAHIERPQGLCLLTGPTGAGKTSTLYAFLSHLSDDEHNLITIEDPVEYELPGVNQTQVNARIGFTFSSALKTVLRQDPDVVMVGEIRDLETAELALQASLTGHMVFSTLHTNDAPGAVTRLADLGIPDYLIASSLTMVVAQRLGRRVCSSCVGPHTPTQREIDRLRLTPEDIAYTGWVTGHGCAACGHTGYKGRIAFMEILTVDKGVKNAMMAKAEEAEIRRAARRAGLVSLREDGLVKARDGITTLEEVLRTTPTDAVEEHDEHVAALAAAQLAAQVAAQQPAPIPQPQAPAQPVALAPVRDEPKRVVVADPDEEHRVGVAAALRDKDYEVVEVGSGEDALDAVARTRADAVFVSAELEDVDGYALTHELRGRQVTVDTPVFVMNPADEDARLDAVRAGATDAVSTRTTPRNALNRLEELLEHVD